MIYFDHSATSPIRREVHEEVLKYSDVPSNASAQHIYGRKSRYLIESARNTILQNLDIVDNYNVMFCSSATECNNTIINSFLDKAIVTSNIEHLSILNVVKDNCHNKHYIPCLPSGIVDLKYMEYLLKQLFDNNVSMLVSIMYANNETGIIQPISQISQLCKKYGASLHTDACQVVGKIPLFFDSISPDFITISSHKIGGPLGAAALIYKKGSLLKPMILGGGQEKNLRSGTENLHAIIGFAKAVDIVQNHLDDYQKNVSILRNVMEQRLLQHSAQIIGANMIRLPNISNIVMKGVSAEVQLIKFDLSGICIGSGASCSSGKIGQSHVLKAMGYPDEIVNSAIRVSLSDTNSLEEVEKFVSTWSDIAQS